MTITQEEQSSISEELKVLIAKRNDYEHSSVKNFSRFFADFLSANNAEIAKEFLEEIKLQICSKSSRNQLIIIKLYTFALHVF